MKIASIYFTKEDIAKNLGIEANQFVFGKVESSYNEIQFDVIIDSDAKVEHAEDVSASNWNVRRQKLELTSDDSEGWAMTPEQIEHSQKFVDLLWTWKKLGFSVEQSLEAIKNSVE